MFGTLRDVWIECLDFFCDLIDAFSVLEVALLTVSALETKISLAEPKPNPAFALMCCHAEVKFSVVFITNNSS